MLNSIEFESLSINFEVICVLLKSGGVKTNYLLLLLLLLLLFL